jgi:hypothetical protein
MLQRDAAEPIRQQICRACPGTARHSWSAAMTSASLRTHYALLGLSTVISASVDGQATSASEKADAALSGYSTKRTGSVHDFDYFAGAWTTCQHRLKVRGAGSTEWEDFPATLCMTLYLGGMATVDELYMPTKDRAASRCAPSIPRGISGQSIG